MNQLIKAEGAQCRVCQQREQDAEQARVQADLHYNELKNSGALDDREFVRAMQLQIQRQNATGETA